jgi:hypothetical protein
MVESRRVRRAGQVARMDETKNAYNFWSGGQKGRDHLENLDVDGRIMLKLTLKE